jgi:hypothetical protein
LRFLFGEISESPFPGHGSGLPFFRQPHLPRAGMTKHENAGSVFVLTISFKEFKDSLKNQSAEAMNAHARPFHLM